MMIKSDKEIAEWKSYIETCMAEDDRDPRHLGRYLTFKYDCPKCGERFVSLTPDYPYTGANSVWTCDRCYSVMKLISPKPVQGNPKSITLESIVRACV